jgi:hypothetical protein
LKTYLKFYILLFLIITACAKRGTITGGAKDSIPPILNSSLPKNFSVDFKSKTVELNFDEYVKLKNVDKELVISPPMKNSPEITPSSASKRITIKLKDTLLENTTYSLNFGKSIEDNNEGNPYQDFKYIFSTGAFIDSLTLGGTIRDAYDKKTDKNVSLMLYEANSTYNDSIIYKQFPRYLTKTSDSSKVFKFENLKAGTYHLIGLKDGNENNKFDPKKEKVAFLNQTISIPNDTIFNLKLFKDKIDFNAFSPIQSSENNLVMGYEGNPKGLEVILKNGTEIIPSITTKIQDKDSVQIWHKSKKIDSLIIIVKNNLYQKDYITKLKSLKKDSLIINSLQRSVLNFREKFTLKSTIPLVKFDNSKITLINKDSVAIKFTTEYDQWNQELKFDFQKEPNEFYKLKILPGAMVDYYDKENDSLTYKFATKGTADYGNLILKLENVKQFPIIVELIDKSEKIIATEYSENNAVIDFRLVEPTYFTVRIIYDANKNREWDSGNYLKKEQPEEVIILPKGIDVRANWDVEQTVNLSN